MFDPASQVVRSEQRNTDERRGGDDALGVPGALSNQPPGVAQTAAVAAGAAGAGAAPVGPDGAPAPPISSRVDLVRNYEVDRTVSRVRGSVGEVQRLSVAVLLDYLPGADGGEPAPLSDAQLADVTALVREAVGFDEARGDTLNIINARFQPEAAEVAPAAPPLWEQPWVLSIGKLVLGAAAVLVLVLTVVRPLVRGLMQSHTAAVNAAQQRLEGPSLETMQLAQQDPLLLAKDLADSDPRRVAQVVKGWVAKDE